MTFIPIGMEALIHKKPNRRKTFAKHCVKAYGLGTSPEHYRCWNLWVKSTCATRISGTVFHKHKYLTNPSVAPEDVVIDAANNLANALKNQMPQHLQSTSLQALAGIQDIFLQAAKSNQQHPGKKTPPVEMPLFKPRSTAPTEKHHLPPPRRSPRLTTKVTENGLIVACPTVAVAASPRPPPMLPRRFPRADPPPRVVPPRQFPPTPTVAPPRRSP